MIDIIEDISKLTTIPRAALDKLSAKAIWCICSAFEELLLSNEEILELDIGIGKLFISNENDFINYKFIPNENLEQSLISTAVNGENPLQLILEKTLKSKITNTYKDII